MVKETYGVKPKHHPGQCKELETFEKDLYNIVSSLKYRKSTDDFQEQMKEDISNINSSPDVFIFANKTNNIYKAPPEQYKKFLKENVTKAYKKSTERLEKSINLEAKNIAKKLDLVERVKFLAKNPAFITLKDHKENFHTSLPCRLINPSRSELGKVSKIKLEKINQALIKHLNDVNQWKNSSTVIEWFKGIDNKKDCIFIKFDIREFYPSISKSIFKKCILFAKEYHYIPDEDVRIIDHCRKLLLFNGNEPWKKKRTESYLEVTMSSYDGAEISKLVGIYILTHLATIIKKRDCGIYEDDGLFVLGNVNGQQLDRTRKNITKIFKDVGFSTDIGTNSKVFNFLDITFSLNNDTYKPYKNKRSTILYKQEFQPPTTNNQPIT